MERTFSINKGLMIAATALAAVAGLLSAGVAYAMTPTLSLSSAGGNSVTVNVNGDANSTIVLYYNANSSSGTESMTIGTTDSSGYFSTVVDNSSIISNDDAYVIVDGQQSSMETWPLPTGAPTLNQTSVTLGIGQSVSVYSEGSSASIYLAENTNPSVASVTVSGTQVTISANQTGTTSATVCYTGTASDCANLGVTVQTGSVVTFSQNNLSLGDGQGSTVTVSGGNGTYTITSNSNPNVASAVLSGTTITVSALEVGTANVTACDSSGNCGTLYITVNTTSVSGELYFSVTNPSLSIGQTISVTVSGGADYYVTGNSNPTDVSETLNGDTLTISGEEDGSSVITVCSASNGCGTLSVNVGSSGSGTNEVTFGVVSPVLALAETMNISLSGGDDGYYVSSNSNTGVAQATMNGDSLSLYGEGVGSDSLVVCANGGGCSTLYVTVSNGTASTATTTVTTETSSGTSSASLLSAIQSMQSQLSQILTQIQTMATTLTQLSAEAGGTGTAATTASTATTGTTTYDFTEFLGVGSQNDQVTELQEYLTQKGFYTGPITGYFGTLTEEAVVKYQAAHGIEQAGYVGPNTRDALNAGE